MPNNLTNPLLSPPNNSFSVVEFSALKAEHFLPALDAAILTAKQNIEIIKYQKASPTFENTLEALEFSSEDVDLVSETYFNLLHAEGTEEIQKLSSSISQKLSGFSSDITLDAKLFERVKSVWDRKATLTLSLEQEELLRKTYKGFVRNGALLATSQKDRLRKIDESLAILSPLFSENVLKHTNSIEMHLTDEKDIAGIPESGLEAAKELAQQKKLAGWLFNLQVPSYLPLVTYCHSEPLREKLWRAYSSRSLSGEFDNRPLIEKTVSLKHERALILGYKNHAQFVLEERMASNPQKVREFLLQVLTTVKDASLRELEELKAFKKRLTGNPEVKPWDYLYFAEKLKKEKLDFDAEEVRPYFKLEDTILGAFKVAELLFDLEFKERSDIPKYHKDVKTYEVTDKKTLKHVGVFLADFFPRETKRNGAWMTNYRDQGLLKGKLVRPIVSIVCNFTKPTAQKPALLTIEEARTLFHEFGHALHSLLSQCRYRSLAGPKVYWDFVELPSQIMENWVLEKETLDLFAKHYQTGEKISDEMIQKIRETSRFHAGWFSLRQVNFGLLDLAWHEGNIPLPIDVEAFEAQVTRDTAIMPRVSGTSISTGFSHIFSGGYSAGYYSYKWAEVLDADAFEYFKESGIFNKEVANKFKEEILARGGSTHPMTLYKNFRGREPDPDALFRRDGLKS
ncbi:MAG: M3 family metallopeptidase [Pseudomonadota bacterium]|mgnify:CR=1 FL=1|nr:M3 family metallopeptidase [Pseudomonadota bacterium]